MCKTETIRGLHVKDYHDLDPKALEEIICLNEQLENNLKEIREAIIKSDNVYALHYLEILLSDNTSHTDYCITCQEDILANMEQSQTSDKTKLDIINIPFPEVEANKETIEEYSKKLNPCDYPDNDGHYSCPFDANGGDDCRNFCGLGVDE